jgi:peptidoglycan/xylan/chitin deacetylase (PgdA/CDA1 family)
MVIVSSWDDGWKDEELIDLFNEENIKTTFCLVGKHLKNNFNIYNNFEVVNHTMNHLNLTKCNLKTIKSEVLDCQKLLEDKFRRRVHGFCYPGGCFNDDIEKLIFDMGFVYTRRISKGNSSKGNKHSLGVDSCIESKNFLNDYQSSRDLFSFYGHAAHIETSKVREYIKCMKSNGDKFITNIEYIKTNTIKHI